MTAPFTVVYDACVLYSAPLRDFLIRLAMTGLFHAKWTDRIHEEWIKAVLRTRPHIKRDALARVRQLMDQAVPDSLVRDHEALAEGLALPDPDDRHVLAAAIKVEAQTIVTINLRDFPAAALTKWNVEAQHPDDFIIRLMELDAGAVFGVARVQRESLRNPAMTPMQFVEMLECQGLTQTASRLRDDIALL